MREIPTISMSIHTQPGKAEAPYNFGPASVRVYTVNTSGSKPDGTIPATSLSQGGYDVLGTATESPEPVPPLAKIIRS